MWKYWKKQRILDKKSGVLKATGCSQNDTINKEGSTRVLQAESMNIIQYPMNNSSCKDALVCACSWNTCKATYKNSVQNAK